MTRYVKHVASVAIWDQPSWSMKRKRTGTRFTVYLSSELGGIWTEDVYTTNEEKVARCLKAKQLNLPIEVETTPSRWGSRIGRIEILSPEGTAA